MAAGLPVVPQERIKQFIEKELAKRPWLGRRASLTALMLDSDFEPTREMLAGKLIGESGIPGFFAIEASHVSEQLLAALSAKIEETWPDWIGEVHSPQ